MTALSERLRLLVTRAGTARELARRAGLGETHVSLAIKRAEEKESGAKQRGEVGLSAAAALARAGDVRLEWLATGEEPMERGGALSPTSVATSPVERARLAAEALGYSARAIDSGVAEAVRANDTSDAWEVLGRIRSANRTHALTEGEKTAHRLGIDTSNEAGLAALEAGAGRKAEGS